MNEESPGPTLLCLSWNTSLFLFLVTGAELWPLESQETPNHTRCSLPSTHPPSRKKCEDNLETGTQIYSGSRIEWWVSPSIFSAACTQNAASVIPSGEYGLPTLNTFHNLRRRGPARGSRPSPVNPQGETDPSSCALQYWHHCHRKGLIKIHVFGWCFSHQHLITPGSWPVLHGVSLSRGQKQITRLFKKQNAQQINFPKLQRAIITQARRGSNLISICNQNQIQVSMDTSALLQQRQGVSGWPLNLCPGNESRRLADNLMEKPVSSQKPRQVAITPGSYPGSPAGSCLLPKTAATSIAINHS